MQIKDDGLFTGSDRPSRLVDFVALRDRISVNGIDVTKPKLSSYFDLPTRCAVQCPSSSRGKLEVNVFTVDDATFPESDGLKKAMIYGVLPFDFVLMVPIQVIELTSMD